MSMHDYLLSPLKSNSLDWTTILITNLLDIILSLLCTLGLHRICISLQVWEKVYSKGRSRDFKGAELESHSDKARPSDI